MMRRALSFLLLAAFVALVPNQAASAPSSEILYRVTQVRNSVWRYDYTLVNNATNPQNSAITIFATYFPYNSATNIGTTLVRAARGWTATAGQGVGSRHPLVGGVEGRDDGVYQATANRAARHLRPGNSLSGFSVEFEWLGPNPPAEQDYLAIHDFDTQSPAVRDNMRVWGDQRRDELESGKGRNRRGVGPRHVTPHLSYYELGRTRLDPSVPEPTTLALVGSGIVGLVVSRVRRKRNSE